MTKIDTQKKSYEDISDSPLLAIEVHFHHFVHVV